MTFTSTVGRSIVHARYREVLADWPVPGDQRLLPTRHGPTFAVSSGPDAGPDLLVLHGSAGTTADWAGDVPGWSRDFRVHAIDGLGEPGLSPSHRPPLGSPQYADWLDDVLTALGIGRFSIVGVSLGAWFGLDYAIRRPGRVERLALLAPAGIGRQKWIGLLPALLLARFGDRGLRSSVRRVVGPIPPGLDSSYLDFAMLVHRHFTARRDPVPVFGDEQLAGLDLLAIVGSADRMFDAAEIARRLPGRSLVVPGAGHLLPSQHQVVLDFLRGGR